MLRTGKRYLMLCWISVGSLLGKLFISLRLRYLSDVRNLGQNAWIYNFSPLVSFLVTFVIRVIVFISFCCWSLFCKIYFLLIYYSIQSECDVVAALKYHFYLFHQSIVIHTPSNYYGLPLQELFGRLFSNLCFPVPSCFHGSFFFF